MMVHGIEPGSIFLSVYEALARAVDGAGGRVLLARLMAHPEIIDEAVESAERLVARRVRGVFYLPHGISGAGESGQPPGDRDLRPRQRPGGPARPRYCEFPQRSAYDLVGVDNLRGGYLLGQHLIDLGCRRTMFFAESVAFSSARARWIGYRAAMEASGIEPRAFGGDPESAATIMQVIRQYEPDGIVCDNDRHAAIIMRHLLTEKIEIPAQIKLAGFDDTPTASLLTVPLTNVRQPAAAIAQRAVSVMHDRIAHPRLPPVHAAVNCELVVRASTGSPCAPSPAPSPGQGRRKRSHFLSMSAAFSRAPTASRR